MLSVSARGQSSKKRDGNRKGKSFTYQPGKSDERLWFIKHNKGMKISRKKNNGRKRRRRKVFRNKGGLHVGANDIRAEKRGSVQRNQ